MKDKSFKYKKKKEITPQARAWIENQANGDDCKRQFLLWAEGTWLEAHFGEDGEPIFRPAVCAWEAWKAAWGLRGSANV